MADTGYSSLSRLRQSVHEVRVDCAFVKGMKTDQGDLAIVRIVVDLPRHFGLNMAAEGVDCKLTLSLLEEMGCDIRQGFLLSRPLPTEPVEAWFAAQAEPQTTSTGEIRHLRATVSRVVFQRTPPAVAVEKLRAITTRPDLLGVVVGWCLADQDPPQVGATCLGVVFEKLVGLDLADVPPYDGLLDFLDDADTHALL